MKLVVKKKNPSKIASDPGVFFKRKFMNPFIPIIQET